MNTAGIINKGIQTKWKIPTSQKTKPKQNTKPPRKHTHKKCTQKHKGQRGRFLKGCKNNKGIDYKKGRARKNGRGLSGCKLGRGRREGREILRTLLAEEGLPKYNMQIRVTRSWHLSHLRSSTQLNLSFSVNYLLPLIKIQQGLYRGAQFHHIFT